MLALQKELRSLGNKSRAEGTKRFFKVGGGVPGYAKDDQFIGVSVPMNRAIAKKYLNLKFSDLKILLKSPVHEDRLAGLVIIVEQYRKSRDPKLKRQVVQNYLRLRSGIDNWDLVDLSAYKIIGDYCLRQNDPSLLRRYAKSKRHWDRRMAIVATFAFIRAGKTRLTFELCEVLLKDPEDLMHKACGWMLREAGKRDPQALEAFLWKYGPNMSRTTLRYAIERMSEKKRLRFLDIKKKKVSV